MYGDGAWWGFGMMLVSLLFIAFIVVGVVFLVRYTESERTTRRSEGSRALDILEERFARGEIDRQEYEERRRILTGMG
jgi:putative membrane protein